ncbi:hypothetical protein KIPB_005211 [Kipferlia bialata]|uniref:Uncharacterized protein n=1 Tax=Kipferlia bialata TaxID=797122 RepID=A0A9K3CWB2_9EUKA|nr:hypothetical protein KIPB_005211 [Kipferlia bialata]|eukprot:g5211.t1
MADDLTYSELAFEKEVARDPTDLTTWLRYIGAVADQDAYVRARVFERCLAVLPRSYKVWRMYLRDQVTVLSQGDVHAASDAVSDVCHLFSRALVNLRRMPRFWIDWLRFLTVRPCRITETRRTFDKALRALPVSQHYLIWPEYKTWAALPHVPLSTTRVIYQRLAIVDPSALESLFVLLKERDDIPGAIKVLVDALCRRGFTPKQHTREELWSELSNLLSHERAAESGVDFPALVRETSERFPESAGALKAALAAHHIHRRRSALARDTVYQGLEATRSVRQYTTLFTAATTLDNAGLDECAMAAEAAAAAGRPVEDPEHPPSREEALELLRTEHPLKVIDRSELGFRLASFEHLLTSNATWKLEARLRGDEHNVQLWHRRVKRDQGQVQAIQSLCRALVTINPRKAVSGSVDSIYLSLARRLALRGETTGARVVAMVLARCVLSVAEACVHPTDEFITAASSGVRKASHAKRAEGEGEGTDRDTDVYEAVMSVVRPAVRWMEMGGDGASKPWCYNEPDIGKLRGVVCQGVELECRHGDPMTALKAMRERVFDHTKVKGKRNFVMSDGIGIGEDEEEDPNKGMGHCLGLNYSTLCISSTLLSLY